mmetsp:Transcript_6717/g.17064  ORF Transcript_6717/g.17064 Transcript_6717/m.17064 type:complete len:325 (+) Transcript_6717:189-1163(+)|eukprot:CAMPEP_0119479018 /NCGR_PEP_ID=MMETSP1344-20130328/8484_1 /TAXON_ID=236787 /ORGANISM="Florenciella parvula, Strain CCMP2471" /LENGTH=324 /DNA_ID=CAMNT_0007513229 /DNA_START=264 /DNA_END=1238 /DNA_ORIENTATION=-
MASIVAPNTDPGFKGGPDEVAPPATFEQSFVQPFEQTELEKTRLSRASPSAVCVSDFPATAESKTTAHEGKADAHVAFGSVHVRLYLSGLSDHPCVSSGVPVGLTDDFLEGDEVSLDDHEIECSNSPPRPWMHVSTLSQAQRLDRCLQAGVSSDEIQRTMAEVREVQENRLQSLPLLPGMDVGSAIEDSIAEMYAAATNKARNTLSTWASRLRAWGDEPVAYDDEPTSPERQPPAQPCMSRSGSDLDRRRAEATAAGYDCGGSEPLAQRKSKRSSMNGLVSWLQQGAEGFTARPSGSMGGGYGSDMRPAGGRWPPEDSEETLEL